jgi:hypothetical protein
MFGVEFGVENRPKKESFGVDFTSHVKHIPKQEDMFGCHVLVPKMLRPPLWRGRHTVRVGQNTAVKCEAVPVYGTVRSPTFGLLRNFC